MKPQGWYFGHCHLVFFKFDITKLRPGSANKLSITTYSCSNKYPKPNNTLYEITLGASEL